MELHLEGSNTIAAPRGAVFDRLTDTRFLSEAISGSEDVRVIDESTLEAKVKVRVAVVSSALKVRISMSDKVPPERATLRVDGSGSGSTLKITSNFTLLGDSPTRLEWKADAEIGGVMAGLGSTLLRSFATKKVDEIFSGIIGAIEHARY